MIPAGSPPEQALDEPFRDPTAPGGSDQLIGGPAAPRQTRRTVDALERLRTRLANTQLLLDDYLARLDAPVASGAALAD
ncbi:hypothetical protein AB0L40_26275 [Patulibacter sp. NPDC049589]|uniref:hypothetical protein n=1 Tax=Patulibacter sp. NPDC049589 TaxID=3154731 RepID=UPI003426BE9E